MTGPAAARLAFAGLGAGMAALFLAQLSARADEAAEKEAAVRWDVSRKTVLVDRSLKESILLNGWASPVLGEGARSISSAPTLRVPTSTAAGDVELTIALAEPDKRPLVLMAGNTPVGAWRPRTDHVERVRVVVPQALRRQSYDLSLSFDLSGEPALPDGRQAAIRVVSVTSRVLPRDG